MIIYPAAVIAHWPGKDTPACVEHAEKIAALADALGFNVSFTPCTGGETCANCQNEEEKLR